MKMSKAEDNFNVKNQQAKINEKQSIGQKLTK